MDINSFEDLRIEYFVNRLIVDTEQDALYKAMFGTTHVVKYPFGIFPILWNDSVETELREMQEVWGTDDIIECACPELLR